MSDEERMTDAAVRAIERGDPIHKFQARQVPSGTAYCAVEASDQFWLWCAEALRRAALAADPDEDGFEATYALLCRTLHMRHK